VNTKWFLLIHLLNLAIKLQQYARVFSMISFKIGKTVLIAKRVTYALFIGKKKSLNRACEVSAGADNAFCFITSFTSSFIGLLAIKASFLRHIPTGESHVL
jgi:hypothetical protein